MKAPRAAAASRIAGATITQAAREAASSFWYLGWLRKAIASPSAAASGDRRSIDSPGSPWRSPPRASTIAPNRSATPFSRRYLPPAGVVDPLADWLVGVLVEALSALITFSVMSCLGLM